MLLPLCLRVLIISHRLGHFLGQLDEDNSDDGIKGWRGQVEIVRQSGVQEDADDSDDNIQQDHEAVVEEPFNPHFVDD